MTAINNVLMALCYSLNEIHDITTPKQQLNSNSAITHMTTLYNCGAEKSISKAINNVEISPVMREQQPSLTVVSNKFSCIDESGLLHVKQTLYILTSAHVNSTETTSQGLIRSMSRD